MPKKSARGTPVQQAVPEPAPVETPSTPPDLAPIDVSGLDTFVAPTDLSRDLHVFVNYVSGRQVKRSYRNNALPKADALRLARSMSDPGAVAEVEQEGGSAWVDFVDSMALRLGFVGYDVKGTYAGESSVEPSYQDNYIGFNEQAYRRFLALSPGAQERKLLDSLVQVYSYSDNEFYRQSVWGRLSGFSTFGSAVGVMPSLDFARVRRFLLSVLQFCTPGAWYSTASLVRYLKTEYPFFLIPREPKIKTYYGVKDLRYGNFHESKSAWGDEIHIHDGDPDGFERVEGRYVERFLEYIPLVLRYVEVAYTPGERQGLYPDRNRLQAFRTSDRLQRVLSGAVAMPRVTVQPDFEVYVDSEFYPAGILARLAPFTDVVSSDVVTILKLQKNKIAAELAGDDSLDVAALLRDLTDGELPQNVMRELAEWRAHATKFTLYQGFALLEGDGALPEAEPYTVERVAPGLRIVRAPAEVRAGLELAGKAPLWVEHSATKLAPLPPAVKSVFPRQVAAPAVEETQAQTRPPLALLRQTMVTLRFPDDAALEACAKTLLDARCPVEMNRATSSLTYAGRYQPQVDKALQALGDSYTITVTDEA